MKFVILTRYESYVSEAEDIQEAVENAYDNHVGYRDVLGVIALPEEE